MQKIGEITAADRGTLEVTFCRPEDCGHCHACDGGQKPTVLRLSSAGQACSVGDFAEVELPTGTVVKASLLAYALPLLLLLNRIFGFGGMIWAQPVTEMIMMAVSVSLLLGMITREDRRRQREERTV